MAKDANNVFSKRSNSSKPYDVSNSFVKQVANRVTNLIPQTSWLNRWLTPPTPSDGDANFIPNQVVSEDDDDDGAEKPPPLKRARIPLNQSFSADSFSISRTSNRNESVEANSKASLSCFQDDREEAGPSGLSGLLRPHLVSSTPATQSHAVPSNSRTAQITPIANGDDRSDSGESTSGCSSLVPQGTRQSYSNETANFSTGTVRRASVDEKDFSSYLQNSRSIFPNRITPRLSVNSSPNPRHGPSFNSSLYTLPFATRSPSLDKSFSSPFYPGPTAYGGASASRKRRSGFFSPSEILPVTQSIQVKPVNRSNSSELSSVTARRILDTLDELSSPVRDAKRVPLTTPTSRKRQAEAGTPGPPTRDLTIPNIPDLLRLHRRMKLQDSLESARIIASSPAATQSPVNSDYRLQLQQDAGRHTNKMTSRRRDLEEDFQQDVHLPNIALPITSLPKFDFMSKQTPKQGFKLGRAVDLSLPNDNISTLLSEAKLSKLSCEKMSTINRIPVTQPPVTSNVNAIPSWPSMVHTSTPPIRLKEKPKLVEGNGPIERSSFGIVVAGELKTGSVMDILGKKNSSFSTKLFENTSQPQNATWECNACLIRNKAEVSQCMSCKTPRSLAKAPASLTNTPMISLQPNVATSKAPAVASGFGTQSKPVVGTWMCKDCYLENKSEMSMCIACRALKPKPNEAATSAGFGSKFLPAADTWECATCMVRNKAASEFCQACEAIKPGSGNNLPVLSKSVSGFGNMFKKAAGSWECSACMVVNEKVSKCVACGTSQPGVGDASTNNSSTASKSSSADLFSLPKGSWECPDCMLVNKDVWKCVACETTKPGIPGFGDMFKKPEGSWECTSCMVSNKDVTKCVACETPKPGVVGFGDKFKKPEGSWECPDCMLPNKEVDKCVACEAPKPGTVKVTQPIPTIRFNFDIPPEASSFKFGIDKAGVSTDTEVKVDKPASAGSFKFGVTSSTGGAAGFMFGKPNAKNTGTSNDSTGLSFGNGVTVSKTSKPETSLPSAALFTFGVPATKKETLCNENGKIESIPATSNVIEAKKVVDDVQLNNGKTRDPFSFSPIKSDGPQILQETQPCFKFGAPTTASSLVVTSNVKLNGPSTVNPLTTTINSTPSFGGIATNSLPPSSSSQSLFGTSNPSPLFSGFSTKTTSSFSQAATTTPSFGQAATTTPSFGQTATTTPSFGQTATTTPSFGQTATTTPSFGQTATTTPSFGQTATTTPSFGLTTSTPSSATLFGTMGKSTPGFNFVSPTGLGQKRSCNDDEDKVPAGKKQASGFSSVSGPTSGNVFGSVTTNATSLVASSTSAPVMSFGSSTKSSEVSFKSSINPSFGSSFSSGSTEGTGCGLTSDKPVASTPFVFGASSGGNGSSAYSFPAKAESSGSTSATAFAFGAASPATGGFNFSSHTNEKPAGGFSFGAAPTTFGAVAPVFGSVQPPAYPGASAGFNFGGSGQQVPTTSVFSFSANTTAPTFAFGQGTTPAPTFDPNARPTFNFTGGDVPQFTAAGASAQPSPSVRRIKKAVRRAPPR